MHIKIKIKKTYKSTKMAYKSKHVSIWYQKIVDESCLTLIQNLDGYIFQNKYGDSPYWKWKIVEQIL